MKAAALATGLLALFVLTAPREAPAGDVAAHRLSARALIARGSFDIGTEALEARTIVHQGRRYALAPLGGALALVPAELLARVGVSARAVQLAESATAALWCALLCALFYSSLERKLGARAALASTALMALATPLWVHARISDGTTLAALLLWIAVRAARQGTESRWAPLRCGLAAGALVLVAPLYTLPAVVLAVYSGGRVRSVRHVALAVVPLALGLAGAALHRHVMGAPPELRGDLLAGVIGLLLSTGKSILLYAPPLAVLVFVARPWWRDHRRDAALSLVVIAAALLATARQAAWHGDPAWGPRHVLPLVPLLLEPVALYLRAQWRVAVAALLLGLAGAWVQLLGLSFSLSTWPRTVASLRQQTGAPGWFSDPRSDSHFIPQLSPIGGHAWLLSHYLSGNKNLGEDAPFRLVVPSTPKLDAEYGRLQLDWWLWPPRVVR